MQEQQKKNRPQYLNTYKMEPDKKSNMTKIKNSMQKCLESEFNFLNQEKITVTRMLRRPDIRRSVRTRINPNH